MAEGIPAENYQILRTRLLAAVEKDRGCWVWQRSRSRGYGKISIAGRYRKAHRIAYEVFVGPIPDGLVIDHLCRNKACINPAHLEPVTQRVNVIERGISPMAIIHRTGICMRGHKIEGSNCAYGRCRTCENEMRRARRARDLADPARREARLKAERENAARYRKRLKDCNRPA